MYNSIRSTGALVGRVTKCGQTTGYLFKEPTGKTLVIDTGSAYSMANADTLWLSINGKESKICLDSSGRFKVIGTLKMKDLPVVTETSLLKMQSKRKKITVDEFLSVLNSNYTKWYTEICGKKPLSISVEDILWRLDTYLIDTFGLRLLLTNADFKSSYHKGDIFSIDGTYIDLSNKETYTELRQIVLDYRNDYQIKDFINSVVYEINKI